MTLEILTKKELSGLEWVLLIGMSIMACVIICKLISRHYVKRGIELESQIIEDLEKVFESKDVRHLQLMISKDMPTYQRILLEDTIYQKLKNIKSTLNFLVAEEPQILNKYQVTATEKTKQAMKESKEKLQRLRKECEQWLES